jgi:predicted MPP superfamily phosphohydrolase
VTRMHILTSALWIACACVPTASAKPRVEPGHIAPPARLRVAVISDLNSRYGSKTYMPAVHAAARALVERVQPDLVLVTGDMVAGQKRGLDYRGMWNAFHDAVTEPLLEAGIPVAPTPGNHDGARGFAAERRQYVAQWTDPDRAARVQFLDASSYPLHYSFVHRGVFFAAVDATAVGPLRGQQHEWLDEQLEQTDAEVKIVFGHLPIHPFARHREREILDDTELESILRRHDVDAYVSGHHHAYYPGAVDGVRHVAAPCLGAGARALIGRAERSRPALVVIDIDASGIVSLEAFEAPDFDTAVPRSGLPAKIELGDHAVVRDDLAAD